MADRFDFDLMEQRMTKDFQGQWVRHADYAQLERDLAEARAELDRLKKENHDLGNEIDSLEEEGCDADDTIRKLEAERDRLAAALREIMKDDQQPSHPCGPQQYGHFGNIARASLQTEPGASE